VVRYLITMLLNTVRRMCQPKKFLEDRLIFGEDTKMKT